MGAQAYTDDSHIELYTSDTSWLAVRLCQTHETADEKEASMDGPSFMRDWNGVIAPDTVKRAHASLPLRYSQWREIVGAQIIQWKDRSGQVYCHRDWVAARRFIAQCARRSLRIRLSY